VSSPRWRAGAAAIALVAAIACDRAPRTSTSLAVAVRVGDLVPSSNVPGTVQDADVILERDTRQVLIAPAVGPALARLDDAKGLRAYRVEGITPAMQAWGPAIIERSVALGGRATTAWWLPVDLARDPTPRLLVAPTEKTEAVTMVKVYAAPAPERLDLETRPFVVPEGGVLSFAAGLRAPAMRAGMTVEARITLRDGDHEQEIFAADFTDASGGWRDERVPLAAFAGHTVRLRFSTRVRNGSVRGSAALFAEPVVLAPRRTPAPLPNVVLLSMDTLRARSVGVYGAERPTTPTLDALARDGTMFENAFSPAAFTLPGHMSMFTGLDVRDHGTVTLRTALDPTHRTLPELFRSAGYATGVVISASWIAPYLGFRRGADTFVEYHPPVAPPPYGVPCEAFTKGLDWMQLHRDRPFFLFLHDFQAHRPYVPPPPYSSLFGTPPAEAGPVESDFLAFRYEQEVRYADDQIRAFLEGLDALGLAERTLLVVTADHGEAFGEHGLFEHTRDVHAEMTQVPLVMRLPGVVRAGRRIVEPASLADILPTALDVAGLPPLPDPDGTSLLPLVTGAAERLARDGVFSQAQSLGIFEWFDLTAIRTRTHTCIHDARKGAVDCFDRRVDPWEQGAALAPDAAGADAQSARAALERYVGARPPLVPQWSTPEASAAPAAGSATTPEAEERVRQLRSLGYVE
jgi:arylsulfatase A-like enzyme